MMTFIPFLRPALAGLLLISAAACGGGGGSDGTPSTTDVTTPSIPDTTTQIEVDTSTEGQRESATALLATWAPVTPPVYTALSAIPLSGSARYDGYIYGALADDTDTITDSVIGGLTLDVTFTAAGADFDGNATGFIDADDAPLTGSLSVSGGSLDRDGNPASDATLRGIGLTGTLTDAADQALIFGIQLEGDFLGADYDALGGAALGGVTVNGTEQDFDGGFIAAR